MEVSESLTLLSPVSLERSDQRCFDAAVGYCELGMYSEADAELKGIEPFNRGAPEVLALQVEIRRGLGKWEAMRETAKRMVEFEPDNIQWVVSYAFASRRAISIEVAKRILLKAVARFPKEGIIYFNLACYDCQLGLIASARDYLKRAFEIEPEWRAVALEDEDLAPLWNTLKHAVN